MPPSNESALTNSFRKYLKDEGAYVNKNHGGPNSQGRPDLEGCYRGLHFGIEVKMPGKEKNLTKLQAHNLVGIRAAGGMTLVATTLQQVKDFVKLLDDQADYAGFE
jgi:hypothetical protein